MLTYLIRNSKASEEKSLRFNNLAICYLPSPF